jgi:hypothetical protein
MIAIIRDAYPSPAQLKGAAALSELSGTTTISEGQQGAEGEGGNATTSPTEYVWHLD